MPEEGVIAPDTIVNDLPTGALPAPTQQQTIVGTDAEIARIDAVLNQDLLTPTPSALPDPSVAPLAATVTPPAPGAIPETVEVDGERVPLAEAIDAFKNKRAWRRENNDRAAELSALERRLQATLSGVLDERIPRPTPAPPPPLEVDLTSLGPRPTAPDLSTYEGQAAYPEYEQKRDEWESGRLALHTAAARDAATADFEQRTRAERSVQQATTDQQRLDAHEAGIRAQFINPASLKELNINEAQAQEVIRFAAGDYDQQGNLLAPAHINPSGPQIGAWRAYTVDDLKMAAAALGHRKAEQRGREEGVKTVVQTIQNAQAASDVTRPGTAPAPAVSGPRYSAREAYENYDGFKAKLDADLGNGIITGDQYYGILDKMARTLTESGLISPPGF